MPTNYILYNNNFEYRALFREITGQKNIESNLDEVDIDDETRDENDYDEACVAVFLEKVFTDTCNSTLFQAVYIKAAEKMLSTDQGIGMTILLSYDFLWAFYPCYCFYRDHPDQFNETNEWYIALVQQLHH